MSTPLHTAIARLDDLGSISDSPTFLVRTFLSSATLQAAGKILQWMVALGMKIAHAPDGTVRGILAGSNPAAAPLLLGSHLDTVIDAGKYDGALGITVGKIHVHPIRGASNSIPQSATFTIDLRHPDDSTLRESLGLLHESFLQIAAERHARPRMGLGRRQRQTVPLLRLRCRC